MTQCNKCNVSISAPKKYFLEDIFVLSSFNFALHITPMLPAHWLCRKYSKNSDRLTWFCFKSCTISNWIENENDKIQGNAVDKWYHRIFSTNTNKGYEFLFIKLNFFLVWAQPHSKWSWSSSHNGSSMRNVSADEDEFSGVNEVHAVALEHRKPSWAFMQVVGVD